MVVITVIALMTDSAFFVVSLVLTLCGVGYLVYRQIDQANVAGQQFAYHLRRNRRIGVEHQRSQTGQRYPLIIGLRRKEHFGGHELHTGPRRRPIEINMRVVSPVRVPHT